MQNSPAGSLKKLLQQDSILTMPCCFDPMSAKLVEAAGFDLSFMSGFSTAAARLGMPDTGLISYGEMVDQGRNINSAVSIPVIGDGDTGYGNALNVKRTVRGYAQAGFAGILIEDSNGRNAAVIPRVNRSLNSMRPWPEFGRRSMPVMRGRTF